MPGIVGVWRPGASASDLSQSLDIQMQRVRVPGVRYDVYTNAGEGFAVGLVDHGLLENGPQPALSEDGNVSLFLHGEILNGSELRLRYREVLRPRTGATPELCLQLMTTQGPDIARAFSGHFTIVLIDRRSNHLTVVTDRFGYRPLYYLHGNGSFLFASELKAVSAVDSKSREIDPVAAVAFFGFGSYVMERTFLQGYRALPPAAVMTVDARGGADLRTYWTYAYDESAPRLDGQTYAMVYRTLLDRAVERCFRGSSRIGIFLSGGYDSRAVAGAIRDHHKPLPAFTFGEPASRDARFGKMLAERLGFDHTLLTFQEPYLHRQCRAIVWRSDGLLSFAHCTSINYHALLKEKLDVFLTGFLGEYNGSHTWPGLLLARSREAVIEACYQRFFAAQMPRLRRIFNRSYLPRAIERIRADFSRSFEVIGNDHPHDVADSWRFRFLEPSTSGTSAAVDRYQFEMRAPLTDVELVDFLLTIPPLARIEHRVYKRMIAYGFPRIRDVPCTNSAEPINPNFALEYALMAGRYGRRAVGGRLARALGRQKPVAASDALDDEFRGETALVDDILRPLLRDGIFPADIYDHAGIEAVIDEHYSGRADHWQTLSLLISWGLAVLFFVHDDLTQAPAEMYQPTCPPPVPRP